jgi:hypothetical protein
MENKLQRYFIWVYPLKGMFKFNYWNRPNLVEFIGFLIKAVIIMLGLGFGIYIWWFYIGSLLSSIAIIWSSTIKTIPTLIWFNMVWSLLSIIVILRHFGVIS